MKGELLLVECDPLGAAVEVLQSRPDVMRRRRLWQRAAPCRETLQRRVHASKIPRRVMVSLSRRSSRLVPLLEDVFVSLTTIRRPARSASHEPHTFAAVPARRCCRFSATRAASHRDHYAGHAHAVVRLRRRSTIIKGLPHLRLRPGRQPAKPGPAQAFPGQ